MRYSDSINNEKVALQDIDIDELEESDITLDKINKDWSIYQLKKGHRYSADDMLTAWMANRVFANPGLHLDIGAGIGSCGSLALWGKPSNNKLIMIEAQKISHELAKRTVEFNNLTHRVELRLGDLRDSTILPEPNSIPLVTGTPPYFPLGTAMTSPHPQRACCRMELRGNIYDYAKTAYTVVAKDGWFVCCHAGADPRFEEAMNMSGFNIRHRQDVIFREGKTPTISILACTKNEGARDDWDDIIIRDRNGQETPKYQRIRVEMGHQPT